MKILIATDAWRPQINGVVRTLSTTVEHLTRLGHEVKMIEPGQFLRFPCAFYPEIHLALPAERGGRLVELGWAEPHQYADYGTEFMVYGPRTQRELDIVVSFVEESLAFAHRPS